MLKIRTARLEDTQCCWLIAEAACPIGFAKRCEYQRPSFL